MSWFKVDDRAHHHAKVLAAGNEAYGAFVRMGGWSSEKGTNGFVPDAVAMSIAGKRRVLAKLLEVTPPYASALLERAEGGYVIHDFLDYNPSADVVAMQRSETSAKRSKAAKKAADTRWQRNADRKSIASTTHANRIDDASVTHAERIEKGCVEMPPDPDPDPDPKYPPKPPEGAGLGFEPEPETDRPSGVIPNPEPTLASRLARAEAGDDVLGLFRTEGDLWRDSVGKALGGTVSAPDRWGRKALATAILDHTKGRLRGAELEDWIREAGKQFGASRRSGDPVNVKIFVSWLDGQNFVPPRKVREPTPAVFDEPEPPIDFVAQAAAANALLASLDDEAANG